MTTAKTAGRKRGGTAGSAEAKPSGAASSADERSASGPRRSPTGYWEVRVSAETPPVFGDVFRPGKTYVVADVVLAGLDALDGVEAAAEPHQPPGVTTGAYHDVGHSFASPWRPADA